MNYKYVTILQSVIGLQNENTHQVDHVEMLKDKVQGVIFNCPQISEVMA